MVNRKIKIVFRKMDLWLGLTLVVMLLVVPIVVLCGCRDATKSEDTVTVVSWGGKYQDALFKDWIRPAAKESKISISGHSYIGEYKSITRMVEAGAVSWDLIQVETYYAAQAKKHGRLERFDPQVPSEDIALPVVPELKGYAYPVIGYSYALAWNQKNLDALKTTPPVII